jgi:hypothetical protein
MANIPIPQQGQPIDYQYIYQIVEQLNELSTKVTSKFAPSKFNNRENVNETHRLNDLSLVAGYVSIPTLDVTQGTEKSFEYIFGVNFKYPPVVTVTPYMTTNTDAARDTSVVISDITTSKMTGYVSFNSTKAGKASVGVNIIAVGVPVI